MVKGCDTGEGEKATKWVCRIKKKKKKERIEWESKIKLEEI